MMKNLQTITRLMNSEGNEHVIYTSIDRVNHVNVYIKEGVMVFEHIDVQTKELIDVGSIVKPAFESMMFYVTNKIEEAERINLEFEDALELVKLFDVKISRKGWNGAYVYKVDGSIISSHTARQNNMRKNPEASSIRIMPHLDKVNKNGTVMIGWVPNQDDMFANDWKIIK